MPAPLTVELLALEARATGTGSGTAVDIGTNRKVAELIVDFQDYSGTEPDLTVTIETSNSETSGWKTVGQVALQDPNAPELFVWDLSRYIRASYSVATATSISFSVSGVASLVYSKKSDIAIPSKVYNKIDDELIWKEMLNASVDADGYLGERYYLPLTTWGGELGRYVGYIATYRIMCGSVGFQPEGSDFHFDKNHDLALRWLRAVSEGSITPSNVKDSSPTVTQKRWAVVSGPRQADDDLC